LATISICSLLYILIFNASKGKVNPYDTFSTLLVVVRLMISKLPSANAVRVSYCLMNEIY
jgi:hypothetical protein